LIFTSEVKSEVLFVSSEQEFADAHNSASTNDSIVWRTGIYSDIRMDIEKDDLTVMAEELGSVIFTDVSRVNIIGDNIVFQGFQYLNGRLGPQDIVNISGSHILFTQINIRGYSCNKYLRVREESRFVDITYCNFENRVNLIDQNILSILVDATTPGYHKIQHCSFKNFEGNGNDEGIEPIRIGVSTQADFASRSVVEHCYFTQCNGDGEIISSKASQNVYRFNTFEDNPVSELVLRHGSENIVYGNFFIDGKGGVRVREGQDHYIYNNYFYDLDDRALFLQNDDSDPLDNINIGFNTIVECSEVRLGGIGNDPPTNVTFSNNLFVNSDDNIFSNATGAETWIGNISFGDLGIPLPVSGMRIIDPELEENSAGFFGLAETSPAIDAAESGFASLPDYMDIENLDTEILFDLMGQSRPTSIAERDLGSNEHPHDILIMPTATEENTGPDYDTSISVSVQNTSQNVNDLISINPNPVSDQFNIEVNVKSKGELRIDIMDAEGRIVDTIYRATVFPGRMTMAKNATDLPAGLYIISASHGNTQEKIESIQTVKCIKLP
jgi:hypothetical protein